MNKDEFSLAVSLSNRGTTLYFATSTCRLRKIFRRAKEKSPFGDHIRLEIALFHDVLRFRHTLLTFYGFASIRYFPAACPSEALSGEGGRRGSIHASSTRLFNCSYLIPSKLISQSLPGQGSVYTQKFATKFLSARGGSRTHNHLLMKKLRHHCATLAMKTSTLTCLPADRATLAGS